MAATGTFRWREPSILPGFGLALGITLTALSLIVLIPLAALFLKAASAGPADIWAIVTSPRTLAALRLSFLGALFAASVNAVFGLILAWVLVRYDFPGRRLIDAAVDLPFALPTAVAGIALAAIYAPNGWIGGLLAPFDIKIAYTPLGVMVALIFVGLPFVVGPSSLCWRRFTAMSRKPRPCSAPAACAPSSRWCSHPCCRHS
jgi:sulfate transport system permease protein